MQQISFKALGTSWWINVNTHINIEKIQEIEPEILKTVQQFENDYSRFKANSKLSLLNLNREFINPSDEFRKLIQISLDYYKTTKGLFNIGLGRILSNNGYNSNYTFKPNNVNIEGSSFNQIPRLDELLTLKPNKIQLLENSFDLDFGGFGKGFLIDKIFNILIKNYNLDNFLINGGGDIRVCGNNHKIWLANPFDNKKALFQINLNDSESLGSSSNQLRKWDKYGHILNPNNITERSETASFVIASNALEADIWATIYILESKPNSFKTNLDYLILDKDLTPTGTQGFLNRIV